MVSFRRFALRRPCRQGYEIRQRPNLPGRVQPSTFGAIELNFCVRDGNRWVLNAITTGNGIYYSVSTEIYLCVCTLTTAYSYIVSFVLIFKAKSV